MNFETGARVGAYQLEQHCGGGAYGEVFVARNVLTKERLALKVLHASSSMKKRELSGLVRYCGCRHPHLIRIFHVEEAGERFYYTMELADDLNEGRGEYVPATLAALLEKRKHLPADEVESLGNALFAALKTLHEKGLVHRDVKPANILFVRGEPVLGDPGLTADADGNSLVGTPEFMSPELLQKKRGSALPEDDFYALRRVLYCAFTGEGPAEFPHCPAGLLDERSSGLWRKILDAEKFSAEPERAPRPRSAYRRPLMWGSIAALAAAALIAALFLLRPSPPPREASSPPDLAELLRRYSDDEAECEKFRLPAQKRFEEHDDSFHASELPLVFAREFNRITSAEFAMKKGELGRLHVERKRRDPLLQLRDTQRDLQNELEWLAAAESVSGPAAAKQSLARVAELFRKRHALLAELRKKQSPSSPSVFSGSSFDFAAELAAEAPHYYWNEAERNPELRTFRQVKYPFLRNDHFIERIPAFDHQTLLRRLDKPDTRLSEEEMLLCAVCAMGECDEIDRFRRQKKVTGDDIRRCADLFRQNRHLVELLYRRYPRWRH